jgi:14-3-3 protein epsilon
MTRESLIRFSKVCQSCGLYEEMISYTRQLILQSPGSTLTTEEIDLVLQSFKHYAAPRRRAWKYFLRELEKQRSMGNERFTLLIRNEKESVEFEIVSICSEFIESLKELSLNETKPIPKILYLKTIGDYSKYLCEVYLSRGNDGHSLYLEKTKQGKWAYEEALSIIKTFKIDCDQDAIILGLYLNWSVFLYEILNRQKEACIIARDALQNGSDNMTTDRTVLDLLQILHNNLVLWTSCRKR